MSSNLTGKFIANTYQKLLQVDNDNGSNGNTANFVGGVVASTENYDLLNGLGEKVPYVVVNHKDNGNGGFFIKNGSTNFDVMGIQFETFNNEKGLNFWTPLESNANLFLKNTGSLWVGYRTSGNPDITTDSSGYSLYVKDGIRVGGSGLTGTKAIQMIGENSLIRADYTNNFQILLNSEYPFTYIQYEFTFNTNSGDQQKNLIWPAGHPDSGNTIDESEYIATVVGFKFNQDEYNIPWPSGSDVYLSDINTYCFKNSGIWKINARYRQRNFGTVGIETVTFNVWVMVIKKGFYLDASSSAISI
jgi:hypothetical protein